MSTRQKRQRFVCTECKWKTYGAPGDEWRHACERCGGQLKPISYHPAGKRAR